MNLIKSNSFYNILDKNISFNNFGLNLVENPIKGENNIFIVINPFDNFLNYLNSYYYENSKISIDEFINKCKLGYIKSQIILSDNVSIYDIRLGIENILFDIFKKKINIKKFEYVKKFNFCDLSEYQQHEIYYIFKEDFLKYNFQYEGNNHYKDKVLNCFVYLNYQENIEQKEIYNHNLKMSNKYNFNYIIISELNISNYIENKNYSLELTKINLLNKFNGIMIDDNIAILNNINTNYKKITFTSRSIYILTFKNSRVIFYTKTLILKKNYNFLKCIDSNLKEIVFYDKVLHYKNTDININKILLNDFFVELNSQLIIHKQFFFKHSLHRIKYLDKIKDMYVGCFRKKKNNLEVKIRGIHPYFADPEEDSEYVIIYRNIDGNLHVLKGYNFLANNLGKVKCYNLENAKTILSPLYNNNLFYCSAYCDERKKLWIKNNLLFHPSIMGKQINSRYPNCLSLYVDKSFKIKIFNVDYPGYDFSEFNCDSLEDAKTKLNKYNYEISKKKLVINSHISYKIAHYTIFSSLIDINFKHFDSIILILGGCDQDEDPQTINLNEIGLFLDIQIVIIKVKINNYDLNGFYALNRYQDHKLIKSSYYIYILDTCTFSPIFNDIFEYSLICPQKLYITSPPGSCLMIFHNKFISKYKNNFDKYIGKKNGLYIEHGINIKLNNTIINSYYNYIKPQFYEKIQLNKKDIYLTGNSRQINYYPFLGIYKYIFLNYSGDISGLIHNNIPETEKDIIKYNMKRGISLMKNLRRNLFK